MRKICIAANWKMYKGWEEAAEFALNLKPLVSHVDNIDIIVCSSFISLAELSRLFKKSKVKVGAQNMHYKKEGAVTGEISGPMVKSTGAEYVMIGHSERRAQFHEDNAIVAQKLKSAQAAGLKPILCVGETLDERDAGKTEDILSKQLEVLVGIDPKKLIIAYEPVWAISTAEKHKDAKPEDAQKEHSFIREKVKDQFGKNDAENMIILYGGSVKPENAEMFLDQVDIDGALVGGASLNPQSFASIIEIAHNLNS